MKRNDVGYLYTPLTLKQQERFSERFMLLEKEIFEIDRRCLIGEISPEEYADRTKHVYGEMDGLNFALKTLGWKYDQMRGKIAVRDFGAEQVPIGDSIKI